MIVLYVGWTEAQSRVDSGYIEEQDKEEIEVAPTQ